MIYEVIESPFTNGKAFLKRKANTLSFRKSQFEIMEHYYVCDDTEEEFTTSELDGVNLNQVYNQYRDIFGILFPDKIKMIREKYAVSASKMSEILGLGTNTYRLYEQGEVPSEGNSHLIMSANNPKVFLEYLIAKRKVLEEKDYLKLEKRIKQKVEEESQSIFSLDMMNFDRIFKKTPDHYTGFRQPDLEKISHMIMFFSAHAETWITKLNKLLFYSDFMTFKNSGFGISGLDYRAIKRGPVPSNYEEMYIELGKGELLERVHTEIEPSGYDGSYFIPKLTFNEHLFNQFELDILEKVSNKFKWKSASELCEISHEELAWKANIKAKSIISYQNHGFYLKAI